MGESPRKATRMIKGLWRISPVRKTEAAETDKPGQDLGEILHINIWGESAKMEPGPVMGPEAKGTDWSTGHSPWASGDIFTIRRAAPAQVTQRNWGIFSARGTQKAPGHNPGLEEGLPEFWVGHEDLQSSLNHTVKKRLSHQLSWTQRTSLYFWVPTQSVGV